MKQIKLKFFETSLEQLEISVNDYLKTSEEQEQTIINITVNSTKEFTFANKQIIFSAFLILTKNDSSNTHL